MSKSTETTNDRVPRVLVRFGKHPSSVGNVHRAWGNVHRVWETSIERGETHIERGETSIERGETWGVPRRCRRGAEALPKAKWRGVGGV